MRLAPDIEEHARTPDISASEADLQRMAKLVRGMVGIDLRPFKSAIIRHRLSGRIRELGLASLGDYLDLLEGPGASPERDRLVSAITTNVTQFFREAHHFELLEQEVLPQLLARARDGGRVRLWSAGCSSGQEPFSMAASVLALCPEAPRLDLRILATDVDVEVLAQAGRATYSGEEIRQISPARRIALFGEGAVPDPATICGEVASLVTFRHLNLVDPWPMRHPFDVIFCRNVVIYLDAEVRGRILRRFVEALDPGGHLFVGHSERVLGPALAELDHAGVTTYRKRQGPPRTRQSGS